MGKETINTFDFYMYVVFRIQQLSDKLGECLLEFLWLYFTQLENKPKKFMSRRALMVKITNNSENERVNSSHSFL